MRCFEVKQFPVEPVVNRILEVGSIKHVISVRGSVEKLPQFGGTLLQTLRYGGGHGQRISS